MISWVVTLIGAANVMPRWRHSSTSYFGRLEVVADEDELARPVEVLDREDAAEDPLQADLLALVRRDVRLQELVVGLLLDVDEVRDLDDLRSIFPKLCRIRKLD